MHGRRRAGVAIRSPDARRRHPARRKVSHCLFVMVWIFSLDRILLYIYCLDETVDSSLRQFQLNVSETIGVSPIAAYSRSR